MIATKQALKQKKRLDELLNTISTNFQEGLAPAAARGQKEAVTYISISAQSDIAWYNTTTIAKTQTLKKNR